MADRRTMRGGHRWQPVLGPANRRVAGRRGPRLGLPSLRLPRPGVRIRRAALVLVVAAALGAGGWWLYQSPLLTVRDVSVEGNVVLSADAVRGVADLEGESMMHPGFDEAEARLQELPIVKEAQIARDWPNAADIDILERTAWGVWEVAGRRLTIDNEGYVVDVPPPEGAPLIRRVDAPETVPEPGDRVEVSAVRLAVELVSTAERTLGRPVSAIEYSDAVGVTAVLGDGLRVTFGDAQGYEFKVAALFAVLERASEQGRTLSQVDLRFGDRVAVQ